MIEQINFLREIREAVQVCTNIDLRLALRDAADDLDGALIELCRNPNDEAMRRANGLWVHAIALLGKFKQPQPPAPLSGGLQEGALLQAVA